MTNTKKRYGIIIIIMAVIIGFAGLFVTLRIYKIHSVNRKFEASMQYGENYGELIKYHTENNQFVFNYAPATFFDMSCFASVCTEDDTKAILGSDGNLSVDKTQITLFIWPLSREYGLNFWYMEQGEEQHIQVYIDKDLNYLSKKNNPKDTAYINSLIDSNREKIEQLFEQVYKQWGKI